MRVGYVRVSTEEQNDARQVSGLEVDKLFADKASGTSAAARPQLEAMLGFVREGDTVVVHSMDRLARNLDDFRRLVRSLTSDGVQVEFIEEHLVFTGDDSPMSNLLLSVMGAFAEFERELHPRTPTRRHRPGQETRRLQGTGSRPLPHAGHPLREALAAGESKAALARQYGISRQTIYRYLAEPAAAGEPTPRHTDA